MEVADLEFPAPAPEAVEQPPKVTEVLEEAAGEVSVPVVMAAEKRRQAKVAGKR